MVLSTAVQWWEERQLHILVLGSLGAQCFILLFASSSKARVQPLRRLLIWLACLGSDAIAIYALAALFNQHKKVQCSSPHSGSSRDLELIWASTVLMHLGGQVSTITAFNIEDNELWRRHSLTALSQVTVALFVFYKSWLSSTNKRVLAAAIFLLIAGLFKCFEKPMALKAASFNTLASSESDARRTTTISREVELEEYIQNARNFIRRDLEPPTFVDSYHRRMQDFRLPSMPGRLSVDYAFPYSRRLATFKFYWLLRDKDAYEDISSGLSDFFCLFYAKNTPASENPLFCHCAIYTRVLAIAFPITAIVLFHSSNTEAFRTSDIKVTLVLLYTTVFLEFLSIGGSDFRWHDMVAQHNLIGSFVRNKRHTRFRSIVACLQCKGFLDQYWHMKPCHSSAAITKLVSCHVKDGWMNYISDAKSYRRFSNIRGQLTLSRNGCDQQIFRGSIEKPFDESILVWHVATDFCFHHVGTSSDPECAILSREISNYMVHLLFADPEMLMPGSRRGLLTSAIWELELILSSSDGLPLQDEKELTKMITNKVGSRDGFLHDAWLLAQALIVTSLV